MKLLVSHQTILQECMRACGRAGGRIYSQKSRSEFRISSDFNNVSGSRNQSNAWEI